MLTLYFSPGSSVMATHIALYEVGAAFEARATLLYQNAHRSPEYLAINAEGKVPTLVIDGRPLTEVAATLWYLARRYPGAGLLPQQGDVGPGDLRRGSHRTKRPTRPHAARQLRRDRAPRYGKPHRSALVLCGPPPAGIAWAFWCAAPAPGLWAKRQNLAGVALWCSGARTAFALGADLLPP
jgi:hypothetical protein